MFPLKKIKKEKKTAFPISKMTMTQIIGRRLTAYSHRNHCFFFLLLKFICDYLNTIIIKSRGIKMMINKATVVFIIALLVVVIEAKFNEIKYYDYDDEITTIPSHQDWSENVTNNDTMTSTTLETKHAIIILITASLAIGGPIIILSILWYIVGVKIKRIREAYVENAFPAI